MEVQAMSAVSDRRAMRRALTRYSVICLLVAL